MKIIPTYSYLRFSNLVQAKGASHDRQSDGASHWLEAKARESKDVTYVLDSKLKLDDLGVSAFRGKNATTGALSGFLKAVDHGEVSSGSYLLVENLDRLSRAQVTVALGLFLSIIGKGITIVTLVDGQEYSQETLQASPYAIMISIATMIRAHEESAVKSIRVADAWRRKREDAQATGKALTSQCPAWLRVEGDVKSSVRTYVQIKERVDEVVWMFEKMAEGWGQGRIAADLMKRKIAPWGASRRNQSRGMRWHDSYIKQISQNRAVLGEIQLYRGDGKSKREPAGDPIPDYYPPIITPELFAKVQAARLGRKVHGFVGRQGASISNLFQGLVYDLKSRERCIYINHGKPEWRYLTPPVKESGQKGWNYQRFETMFLEHCRLLNWAEIFGETNIEAVALAEREVQAAGAELARINALIARYAEAVGTAPDVQSLVGKLRALEESKGPAQAALEMAQNAHASTLARQESLEADSHRIKLLASGKLDTVETRLRVREEIRRVVHRIDASFSKRGGHYLLVTYANGAKRYLRPNQHGDGVKILDERECGFMGTPEK